MFRHFLVLAMMLILVPVSVSAQGERSTSDQASQKAEPEQRRSIAAKQRPSIGSVFTRRFVCEGMGGSNYDYKKKNETNDKDLDKAYSLYRKADGQPRTSVGSISVKHGDGFLDEPKPMTLMDLEKSWGASRENVIMTDPNYPNGIVEKDCRVFDLIAIDKSDRQSIQSFTVYVNVQSGYLRAYVIDGPGIIWTEPKVIGIGQGPVPTNNSNNSVEGS